MPAPFGVTPTGFSAKTLEEILDEMSTEARAEISSTLDTSASAPIGQLFGIVATKLRELWELGQADHDAFNPDNASDFSLTVLALITGTQRKGATKSTVLCDLGLDAGTFPAGTLIAHVDGDPDARFVNVNEIVSTGGPDDDKEFIAESTGPLVALATTLTVIAEPVVGWNTVNNPLDATEGEDIETDVALRPRRELELARVGSSTVDAIRADVAQVKDVKTVIVFENTKLTPDANGVPGKAFEVVIFDGPAPVADNDAIAQAIWDSKPAGIESFGALSGTAKDSEGADHTIFFSRAVVKDVHLEFTITSIVPPFVPQDMRQAVADFGDTTYKIGDDVILSALCTPAFSVPGLIDILNTTAGFVTATDGDVNLPIGAREIADLDTSRISFFGG